MKKFLLLTLLAPLFAPVAQARDVPADKATAIIDLLKEIGLEPVVDRNGLETYQLIEGHITISYGACPEGNKEGFDVRLRAVGKDDATLVTKELSSRGDKSALPVRYLSLLRSFDGAVVTRDGLGATGLEIVPITCWNSQGDAGRCRILP